MGRLKAFLPAMEKANLDLRRRIAEGENVKVEMDNDEDDDDDDDDGCQVQGGEREANEMMAEESRLPNVADITARKMAIEMTLGLFEREDDSSEEESDEEEEEEEEEEEADDDDEDDTESATNRKRKTLIAEID